MSSIEATVSFILSIVATVLSVALAVIQITDRRKNKPSISTSLDSGFFEFEENDVKITLNLLIDNRGMKASSVTRIKGLVPTRQNGITTLEGVTPPSVLPKPLSPDSSDYIKGIVFRINEQSVRIDRSNMPISSEFVKIWLRRATHTATAIVVPMSIRKGQVMRLWLKP